MNAQQERAAYDEMDAAMNAERRAAINLADHVEFCDRHGIHQSDTQQKLVIAYRSAMQRREAADRAVQALR